MAGIGRFLRRLLRVVVITVLALVLLTYIVMQQKTFGKIPSGQRLERIKKSPNYRDESFQNVLATQVMAEGTNYVKIMREFFAKGVNREPSSVLPSIKTDLKTLQSDKPLIVWFGHSTYLIVLNGKRILVDPIFSERASPFSFIGSKAYPTTNPYSLADFPDIDVVIISHDHYDHLDYNTITQLKATTKLFCTPVGVGSHLEHWGVSSDRIKEFDWWQGEEIFPGMTVTATPARHFSGRGFKRGKTLWASFVVKTDSARIYIGGDSGYSPSFKEIGEKYGPFDMALLECGQYDKKWPSIHMMPEETAQAAVDLKAKAFIPVHWAKFTLSVHPWNDPILRVTKKAQELGLNIVTPTIGERVVVDTTLPHTPWWSTIK